MIPPTTTPKATIKDGPGGDKQTVKTHPAFGLAGFSRVSGSSGQLFGTEIESNAFIRFTLHSAEESFSLSHKWYFGRKHLVEFDLSCVQFAEMLTSMNVGQGVPCTIRYLPGEQIERFEDKDTMHDLIQENIREDAKEIIETAEKFAKQLEAILVDSKLPKAKQEVLRNLADKIVRDTKHNMPFVVESYQEATDKITANGKAEVDAFVTHVVNKLGAKALAELGQKDQRQIEASST